MKPFKCLCCIQKKAFGPGTLPSSVTKTLICHRKANTNKQVFQAWTGARPECVENLMTSFLSMCLSGQFGCKTLAPSKAPDAFGGMDALSSNIRGQLDREELIDLFYDKLRADCDILEQT